MKRTLLFIVLAIGSIFYMGCEDPVNYVDRTPPGAPTGLYVENGDGEAYLYWNSNTERDLAGYNIYSSSSYNGKYYLIGTTRGTTFTDSGIKNGTKYYYAVTAYDYDGNESDLSYELAYSAPRPEGYGQAIFDYHQFPALSAFSFASESVVADTDASADFYFDNDNGTYYLDVFNDTDIKDMGRTSSIYDITTAPSTGWSSTKDAPVIIGHTYVIWTVDNHYAKIRVSSVNAQRVVFDWAYQSIKGEVSMKTAAKAGSHSKVVRVRDSVQ
jgi:hypothetical protein